MHGSRTGPKIFDGFPQVPIRVITHSSEKMIARISRSGGLSVDDAQRVETLWQELIRAHTGLAPDSRLIVAKTGGHNIHLDEPEIVTRTVLELVEEVRVSWKRSDRKPRIV
jgi:hypothetical protein